MYICVHIHLYIILNGQIQFRMLQTNINKTILETFHVTPTVHLDKELVECVLLLTVSPEASPASLPAHGINLINEENTRRVLACHRKHVPYLQTQPGCHNKCVHQVGGKYHTHINHNSQTCDDEFS